MKSGKAEWQHWVIAATLDGIPTSLVSTSAHLCIPCAITNVAAYWTTNGSPGFGVTSSKLDQVATTVQNVMSNNGTTNGHTANANIQRGFDIFHHTLMLGVTNTLSAKNVWRNSEGFTWNDIADSINSGKPLLLGFAGTSDSPYGGAHMTVCIGYRIEDDMLKVVVSDAHKDYYRTIKFNLSTYNDFISKVSVVQNYAA